MKKILFNLCLMASLLLVSLSAVMAQEGAEISKEQAVESAQIWLSLVDEGKYEESWQEAASYFKGVISAESWADVIAGVRTPLGAVISREILEVSYHQSLPGAPDGEYVIILFTSSFENKLKAVETITPMKDKDGQWRTSGYYIK